MATKPWQQIRADRSKLTPEQQTAVDLRAQSTIARMHLGELRRARAFTQKAIAENSGIAQGEVSKIEHRTDAYVSTLRNFIEAMGGTFRMIAEFPGGDPVEIAGFADLSADARSAKAPTPASATP